jgi:hypothetical protein
MEALFMLLIVSFVIKMMNAYRTKLLAQKFQNDLLSIRGRMHAEFIEKDFTGNDLEAFQHLYNNVFVAEKILVNTNIWMILYKVITNEKITNENVEQIVRIEKLIDKSNLKCYYSEYLNVSGTYFKKKSAIAIFLFSCIIYIVKKTAVFFTKSVRIISKVAFQENVKLLATSLEYKQENLPFAPTVVKNKKFAF